MSIAFTFKVGNVAFCNLHIAFCDTQLRILFCHLFFVNFSTFTKRVSFLVPPFNAKI